MTSTSSTTTTTGIPGALSWYVDVNGSDATGDGRRVNPFRTANYAMTIAIPGDTILLMDNDDTKTHSAIKVSNRSHLTIRCETEGACSIIVDGRMPGVEIDRSPGITLQGVMVKTADNSSRVDPKYDPHTIFAHDSSYVTIRRNTAWRNNRYWNAHPIRFENMTDSLIEENACLEHSRHCISDHGGKGNTIRRNWIDNMGRKELVADPPGGTSRESIACYPCTKALIANNLIEGKLGWGLGGNAQAVEEDNLFVGNVVAYTYLGIKVYARPSGYPIRTTVRDNVVVGAGPSFDIRDQVTIDTLYDHLTTFGGTSGMEVDNPTSSSAQRSCTEVPGTPGVTIRDSIIGGPLAVEACTGKTRKCVLDRVRASSFTLMPQCVTTGLTGVMPANIGNSGAGKGLVRPSATGLGADVRCVIGADGNRTTEDLWGPDGQFRFCPPERPGWPSGCRTYAERNLNHKKDGSGLPLAETRCGGG